MNKSYSKKERATIKLIRNSIIAILLATCLIAVAVIVSENYFSSGPYTAEQMLHDHDGDGIPDHD